MRELVIIGAGGYGRQVYDIAKVSIEYQKDFIIKGFIDNIYNKVNDNSSNYPPILSNIDNYTIEANDVFVCAVGDVKLKKHFIKIIENRGGEFISLIHPSVKLGSNVTIGKGCIIGHNTFIDSETIINDYVSIQANVVIGHDNHIESGCMIDCFSFTGGGCHLEENVVLHTRSTIIPRKNIGSNSVINACSLIIRDVKANSVMMGNPAKPLLIPKV